MCMSIEVLRQIKVRANFEPAFREQLLKSPLRFLQEYDLTEDEKIQIVLPHPVYQARAFRANILLSGQLITCFRATLHLWKIRGSIMNTDER